MTTKPHESPTPTTEINETPHPTEEASAEATANDSPKDSSSSGMIALVMIPATLIDNNAYNPNVMKEDQQRQYTDEVRRLGLLPKPVVVRRVGDRYEVIDGEHGLQAAKDVGMAEVPCEVVAVDDFEAMRQNYTRNQHGKLNPLLVGRMFQAMEMQRGMSNHELAKQLRCSEGTVRNFLAYVEAVESRNRYAPDRAEAEIAQMKVREVHKYLDLAEGERDVWLDGEAIRKQGEERIEDEPQSAGGEESLDKVSSDEGASTSASAGSEAKDTDTAQEVTQDDKDDKSKARKSSTTPSLFHQQKGSKLTFKDVKTALKTAAQAVEVDKKKFGWVVSKLKQKKDKDGLIEVLKHIRKGVDDMLGMLSPQEKK